MEKAVVGEWLIFTSCGGWAQLYHWNLEQWTTLKTNFSYSSVFCVYLFWRTVGCWESLNEKAFVCKGEKSAFLVSYLWWRLVTHVQLPPPSLHSTSPTSDWFVTVETRVPMNIPLWVLKVVYHNLYLFGKVPWFTRMGSSGTGVIIWTIVWSAFLFSIETLCVNISCLSK